MNFMENMKETLNNEFNESITENGAIGYKTTGKEIVDFNYKIASYRNKKEEEIINDWEKVWLEDKTLAMQFLFFIRDREEGLGERRLFRIIIKHLANEETEIMEKVILQISEYGRWDDLLSLFNTPLEYLALEIICGQLFLDDIDRIENKKISLCAKWIPSINASNIEQKMKAKKIIKALNTDEKNYRKLLSRLRAYIDVTERKMCKNEWNKIKYEGVPSRANLNYNNAFLRHDEERRREYLDQVSKGEKKINGGKLYPHDIVHKYGWAVKKDDSLEALWKALPQKEIDNTLVVADGSGSMTSRIGNTTISALDVANALAIYFAEHNKGEFKDKYITFSSEPKYVDFNGLHTLRDKIKKAQQYDECSNTNIEKVFDLILATGVQHKLTQEEMPKNILIISDMEFDNCVVSNNYKYGNWGVKGNTGVNVKLFKEINERYRNAGYKMPRLIFWNVNSRTGTIPLKQNDLGVALVSGFSTNIAEMVMSNKLDPYEILLEKLNTPRYMKIKKLIEGETL